MISPRLEWSMTIFVLQYSSITTNMPNWNTIFAKFALYAIINYVSPSKLPCVCNDEMGALNTKLKADRGEVLNGAQLGNNPKDVVFCLPPQNRSLLSREIYCSPYCPHEFLLSCFSPRLSHALILRAGPEPRSSHPTPCEDSVWSRWASLWLTADCQLSPSTTSHLHQAQSKSLTLS